MANEEATVAAFVRRMDDSSEHACVLQVLEDIAQVVSQSEMDYLPRGKLLDAVVARLKPSFVGLLTESEFRSHVVGAFLAAPIEEALLALVAGLRAGDSYRLSRVVRILDACEESSLEKLFVKSLAPNEHSKVVGLFIYEMPRIIGQIPDLIYNAMGESADINKIAGSENILSAFLSNHQLYMLIATQAAVEAAKQRLEDGLDVDFRLVAGLLPSILRGNFETFRRLVSWLGSRGESPIWARLSARLLTDTSNGFLLAENVAMNVVLAVTDGLALMNLLGDELVRNTTVCGMLFHTMLLVKVFGEKENVAQKLAVCLGVGSASEVEGRWSELHVKTAVEVIQAWASLVYIRHASDAQQDYVERALLWLVKTAREKLRGAVREKVHVDLLEGTSIHLECGEQKRRWRGVFITETLTKWLSIGDLKFEYPPEASKYLCDLRDIVEDGDTTRVASGNVKPAEENNASLLKGECTRKLTEVSLPPRAEVVDELDSDDDFPVYEIPENELHIDQGETSDGRNAERVFYVRDCLEGLCERENCDKFEASFDALNGLIRKRGVGYDEIVESLLERLIFLDDRFHTTNFQERRTSMIVSCLVMSPQLASFAITAMFGRNCPMQNRFTILKALAEAATELSTPPSTSSTADLEVKDGCCKSDDGKEKPWRQVVDERVALKTRRFGASISQPTSSPNRFANVAPNFFFPLLERMQERREHLNLLGGDFELLAKVLLTAAQILQCAENCLCTSRMARALNEYLLPLQGHPQSAVRHAAVMCYGSICVSLSDGVFVEHFSDCFENWIQFAAKVIDDDPSAMVSAAAKNLIAAVLSKVEVPKLG